VFNVQLVHVRLADCSRMPIAVHTTIYFNFLTKL